MAGVLQIEPVVLMLPPDFAELRADARDENFAAPERLAAEWASGQTLFDGDSEALLAAYADDTLAGIGGITIDPVVPDALRMRRFFVRQRFRGRGVGRALAETLLAAPRRAGRVVFVNASKGSIGFWELLGFAADPRDGHTHVLTATGAPLM